MPRHLVPLQCRDKMARLLAEGTCNCHFWSSVLTLRPSVIPQKSLAQRMCVFESQRPSWYPLRSLRLPLRLLVFFGRVWAHAVLDLVLLTLAWHKMIWSATKAQMDSFQMLTMILQSSKADMLLNGYKNDTSSTRQVESRRFSEGTNAGTNSEARLGDEIENSLKNQTVLSAHTMAMAHGWFMLIQFKDLPSMKADFIGSVWFYDLIKLAGSNFRSKEASG